MQNLWEFSIENFSGFQLIFLHILIKQLLSLLAVKLHTDSFFFLGDIYSIISGHVVVSQCVGQQLTYKLGDLFIPKTKHFLVFTDNNSSDLIEKKHKEHMIKLSKISFL